MFIHVKFVRLFLPFENLACLDLSGTSVESKSIKYILRDGKFRVKLKSLILDNCKNLDYYVLYYIMKYKKQDSENPLELFSFQLNEVDYKND